MNKKKYTIAQILPALNTGGVERGVIEISKSLNDNGFKSIVLSSGGHMVPQLRRTGTTHYELNVNTKNPFKWPKIRKQVKLILEKENVDLIHLCSRAPAWIVFPLGRMLDIPVITSVHMRFRKTNFLKKYYNSILTKGDSIIAISKHIEKTILESFPNPTIKNKITVVHRGVDLELFNANNIKPARVIAQSKNLNLKDNIPVIMMAARPAMWKGYLELIRALSLVNDTFQCVLIGAENGSQNFQKTLIDKIIKLKLETKVKLSKSSNDIQAALMLSDIVVMPSVTPEPFGRIILEAQALGKIPIAFDHGGASETIIDGKNGFLADPVKVESLAEKISMALSLKPTSREKMSEFSKKAVSKNFSHDKMCKLTLSLYKQCILEYKAKI
ncbi:glycosyltransferase family 4 protein [Alphaproteobacteria bacterium]|jgi:glycosyltransferase involved in cell wall biosynthesis|nr:glycosyltransferase family 4 protein [Alphaproteobacteria bacterium]MDA9816531.1 glycosyltransferase family 4 protein [Alphaproteobacteria bacterium]MDB2583210.1 glycosyltransferase family 4 protein [Alphaproteobacteria bacterium]